MQTKKIQKKAIIKAAILIAFIICAVIVVRFTPIKGFLTADQLGRSLENAGFWAPLLFMVIYAVGVCLFVPGTVLGAMGAVLFGTLKEVWTSGNWGELLSFKVFFSVALFVFSLFLPKIIKKFKEA